jgi:hypothetical protein
MMNVILNLKRIFVSITLYFVGGIVFMRHFRNANGLELIPNLSFWKSQGENVKVNLGIFSFELISFIFNLYFLLI